eukprot:2379875-Amphidinium_carterae.1
MALAISIEFCSVAFSCSVSLSTIISLSSLVGRRGVLTDVVALVALSWVAAGSTTLAFATSAAVSSTLPCRGTESRGTGNFTFSIAFGAAQTLLISFTASAQSVISRRKNN